MHQIWQNREIWYWDLNKGVVIKEKELIHTDSTKDIEGGDPDEKE